MNLSGREIGVLGCGRSGAAAARLGASLGASVSVLDSGSGEAVETRADQLRGEGFSVVTGDAALSFEGGLDTVVVSPGIDPSWPLVAQFREMGTPVISEIEFASQNASAPVVAVTGTNGKTTTTELVAAMLGAAGRQTVACGNYGTAFSDVVRTEGPRIDIHTVEVSSFQLELIDRFRPSVAVWMNFAADHLDRHPSVEAYRAAKLRIFENQTPDDFAVVRLGEDVGDLAAETVTFSAFEDGADYTLSGSVVLRNGVALADLAGTRLRGRHNAENAMAALAAAGAVGVPDRAAVSVLSGYRPPHHRCELVASHGGVDFINDSKATNLHALESALRSLDASVVLIAGGKDKGLDYRPLTGLVSGRATSVVAIGEIAGQLARDWGGAVPCHEAKGLAEAVRMAAGLAAPGEVVLFSPGTSSFDMFSGYEARGDAFKAAVEQIVSNS